MADKYKCKLLPFERHDVLNIQEAKQKAGWEITAFDLPKMWEKTQGEGVTIGVLDTGCDLTHEDLKNNLVSGYNVLNPGQPPVDGCGHGTHITGILVAENNDVGVVGVCPKAKVMPVKVLDDKGNGNMLNVAVGIRWAVDHGADMLAMSLGTPVKIQQVRKAIQYAAEKGVPCFVASGNAGKMSLFYPANYPETISVGAVDVNFKKAEFSNCGENLDFMAPGVDILSTVPPSWYAVLSGTSMAQPFACGVAALLLSYARNHKTDIVLKTVDDYKEQLKKFTTPIQNGNYSNPQFYQGFGIIDPRKLKEALKE